MEEHEDENEGKKSFPVSPLGMVGGERHPKMFVKDLAELLERHDACLIGLGIVMPTKVGEEEKFRTIFLHRVDYLCGKETECKDLLKKKLEEWAEEVGILGD